MKTKVILAHGERAKDCWTTGKAFRGDEVWHFQVKHFDNPSQYGINGGRISKLWLKKEGAGDARLEYDRGWLHGYCLSTKGRENVNAIYRALIEKFN